jgi:RNA-directed DNA polymerase
MKPLEGNMTGTPSPGTVYTKQQRIAKFARDCPDLSFTNLAHHMDYFWLYKAYELTHKGSSSRR